MERKVTKIGNSYGITFPKELLKEAGISYGDHVQLELEKGNIILHKKEKVKLPNGIDNDFLDIVNDVIREHDTAFKGLVDK
ncbi:MAG TPA: AbrB/MazE/SpoVT family DNA-binding domain-containing protein [Bacillota bacterium]|nr:AbrB/MazE/SpoVT family DNA-binding domain-containing protein [Bacillota bacterium]